MPWYCWHQADWQRGHDKEALKLKGEDWDNKFLERTYFEDEFWAVVTSLLTGSQDCFLAVGTTPHTQIAFCMCSSILFLLTHPCPLEDPTLSIHLALGHLDWRGRIWAMCLPRWSDSSWNAAVHVVLGTLVQPAVTPLTKWKTFSNSCFWWLLFVLTVWGISFSSLNIYPLSWALRATTLLKF